MLNHLWNTEPNTLLNTTQYPACIIPVGKVGSSPGENFTKSPGQFAPPCKSGRVVLYEFVLLYALSILLHCSSHCNNACWFKVINVCLDNPKNLEGAPTAIQIATTSMRDEECLAIARLVDGYVRAKAGGKPSTAKL